MLIQIQTFTLFASQTLHQNELLIKQKGTFILGGFYFAKWADELVFVEGLG